MIYNELFIRSLTNVMKEAMYGALIHQIGLAYFGLSKKQPTHAVVGEQVGSSSQGGGVNLNTSPTAQNIQSLVQQLSVTQSPVQQPIMTNPGGYIPPLASKNALVPTTPYQGRVPSGVP
jgi:hypothetical protein